MKKLILALLIIFMCLALFSCGGGHEHKFASEWSTNESYHYNACTKENCEATRNKQEHQFGEKIVVEATKDKKGSITEVCNICEYEKVQEITYTATKEDYFQAVKKACLKLKNSFPDALTATLTERRLGKEESSTESAVAFERSTERMYIIDKFNGYQRVRKSFSENGNNYIQFFYPETNEDVYVREPYFDRRYGYVDSIKLMVDEIASIRFSANSFSELENAHKKVFRNLELPENKTATCTVDVKEENDIYTFSVAYILNKTEDSYYESIKRQVQIKTKGDKVISIITTEETVIKNNDGTSTTRGEEIVFELRYNFDEEYYNSIHTALPEDESKIEQNDLSYYSTGITCYVNGIDVYYQDINIENIENALTLINEGVGANIAIKSFGDWYIDKECTIKLDKEAITFKDLKEIDSLYTTGEFSSSFVMISESKITKQIGTREEILVAASGEVEKTEQLSTTVESLENLSTLSLREGYDEIYVNGEKLENGITTIELEGGKTYFIEYVKNNKVKINIG